MGRRTIQQLLALILPQPVPGATAWTRLDWPAFWRTFDARAPLHLRLGLVVAALLVGGCYLRLRLGPGWRQAGDAAAPPTTRERLDLALGDASRGVLLGQLVEVLKVVASLAYFDDAATDRALRDAP